MYQIKEEIKKREADRETVEELKQEPASSSSSSSSSLAHRCDERAGITDASDLNVRFEDLNNDDEAGNCLLHNSVERMRKELEECKFWKCVEPSDITAVNNVLGCVVIKPMNFM